MQLLVNEAKPKIIFYKLFFTGKMNFSLTITANQLLHSLIADLLKLSSRYSYNKFATKY